MMQGEALQYDMQNVLGLPSLPAWLTPTPPDEERLARSWLTVRDRIQTKQNEAKATALQQQATEWAERRTESGCDLSLLPRLGYPAVDIAWLREAVTAYMHGLARLLTVWHAWQQLADVTDGTKAAFASSHVGWTRPNGATLVLQDMQRTLRVAVLPPEWELLGQLPTYLYHLWPSMRAALRDIDPVATLQPDQDTDIAATADRYPPHRPHLQPDPPIRPGYTLSLQLLLMAIVAVRLGLKPAAACLDAAGRVDNAHNTEETARGRDPAPCHT